MQCAEIAEVEWDPIEKCSNSREGAELLKANGEETSSLDPRVSFIPTIVINHSQGVQKDILKNLMKEVCKVYTVSTLNLNSVKNSQLAIFDCRKSCQKDAQQARGNIDELLHRN